MSSLSLRDGLITHDDLSLIINRDDGDHGNNDNVVSYSVRINIFTALYPCRSETQLIMKEGTPGFIA